MNIHQKRHLKEVVIWLLNKIVKGALSIHALKRSRIGLPNLNFHQLFLVLVNDYFKHYSKKHIKRCLKKIVKAVFYSVRTSEI